MCSFYIYMSHNFIFIGRLIIILNKGILFPFRVKRILERVPSCQQEQNFLVSLWNTFAEYQKGLGYGQVWRGLKHCDNENKEPTIFSTYSCFQVCTTQICFWGKGTEERENFFPETFLLPFVLDLIFLTHYYLFCFLPRRNFTECLQFIQQIYLFWHAVIFISFKRK